MSWRRQNGLQTYSVYLWSVDALRVSIIDVRRKLNFTCEHHLQLWSTAVRENGKPEKLVSERNKILSYMRSTENCYISEWHEYFKRDGARKKKCDLFDMEEKYHYFPCAASLHTVEHVKPSNVWQRHIGFHFSRAYFQFDVAHVHIARPHSLRSRTINWDAVNQYYYYYPAAIRWFNIFYFR